MAELLGISTAETVRKWVRQVEIDRGARPGTTSEESAELNWYNHRRVKRVLRRHAPSRARTSPLRSKARLSSKLRNQTSGSPDMPGRFNSTSAMVLNGPSWKTVVRMHSDLEQAVDGLHQSVVVGVADATDGWPDAFQLQVFGEPD